MKNNPLHYGRNFLRLFMSLLSLSVIGIAHARYPGELVKGAQNGTPVVATIRFPDDTFHAVVIDGITTRNGVRVVAIRDPHGVQYFSPVDTFRRTFTGIVTVPRPRR